MSSLFPWLSLSHPPSWPRPLPLPLIPLLAVNIEWNRESHSQDATIFFSLIKWWAQHKGYDGYKHDNSWYAKAPTPASVVLNVNHNGQGTKRSQSKAEKVPIEEVPFPRCHTIFCHVKLVPQKGHNTRPNATGSKRCEEERDVEHAQLWGCGFLAISLCWTWWGAKMG